MTQIQGYFFCRILKSIILYEMLSGPQLVQRLRAQVLTGLDVHVHQRCGVDVLEAPCDLQQQVLQLQLAQVTEPPVILGDGVRERAAVAVLVLDEHVVVLGPGGVVAHHVGMLAQHGMGVHLPQGVLSAEEGNRRY